jgi:hypothetical protein
MEKRPDVSKWGLPPAVVAAEVIRLCERGAVRCAFPAVPIESPPAAPSTTKAEGTPPSVDRAEAAKVIALHGQRTPSAGLLTTAERLALRARVVSCIDRVFHCRGALREDMVTRICHQLDGNPWFQRLLTKTPSVPS